MSAIQAIRVLTSDAMRRRGKHNRYKGREASEGALSLTDGAPTSRST